MAQLVSKNKVWHHFILLNRKCELWKCKEIINLTKEEEKQLTILC